MLWRVGLVISTSGGGRLSVEVPGMLSLWLSRFSSAGGSIIDDPRIGYLESECWS